MCLRKLFNRTKYTVEIIPYENGTIDHDNVVINEVPNNIKLDEYVKKYITTTYPDFEAKYRKSNQDYIFNLRDDNDCDVDSIWAADVCVKEDE